MMDTTIWAKLRDEPRLSWHVIIGDYARCGRRMVAPAIETDDLPMGEKSCESCARLTLHDQEKAAR